MLTILLAANTVAPAIFGQAEQSTQPSSPAGVLTLGDAEALALQNHPQIASARLLAKASEKMITETRSGLFPTAYGNLTSVAADHATVLAAGALQTSSLSTRFAAGMGLSQMITDFGRTLDLVRSASLRAKAQSQTADDVRAQILLSVRQSYYQALAAEAVQNAANAALENRQLTLRQVTALAASNLKSTLDVNFAEVLVSEAELAVFQAENNVHESMARLSAAIGSASEIEFRLADQALPPPIAPSADDLVSMALQSRPDLKALESMDLASHQYAQAEKRLSYPVITLLGIAGETPEHDSTLHFDDYSAAGVNINIPLFNGRLYAARHAEADLRAQANDKNLENLKLDIARDVRIGWFEAETALRRLDVTSRLVAQANEALRLAQARYDNGLGSIVELNEAQLNQTSAQIASASAKYEYLSAVATLDYATGAIQ